MSLSSSSQAGGFNGSLDLVDIALLEWLKGWPNHGPGKPPTSNQGFLFDNPMLHEGHPVVNSIGKRANFVEQRGCLILFTGMREPKEFRNVFWDNVRKGTNRSVCR
jgi:hypothetical protein